MSEPCVMWTMAGEASIKKCPQIYELQAENAKLKAEMEDWRNKCVSADDDNGYYRSIFDGSWPTAIETLEATLKVLKEPTA